jgi:predicted RNase H-like HicB family nuclease
MTKLIWKREAPSSVNNFDLVVENPGAVDPQKLEQLLNEVLREKHRVFLSGRASEELQRWFSNPASPLKSEAYVLLSNWFLTRGGDKGSLLASRCEELWDALFPCRPPARLSSSRPGRNHLVVAAAFDSFWQRVLAIQSEQGATGASDALDPNSERRKPDESARIAAPKQYDVVIERDVEGFYIGSVPQLPGCHTQARSLDELMERIQEAIALCLEIQDGPPPPPLEFIGVQRVNVTA